ncbi:MAG: cation:proton antiporter [Acidimicrobiia bacterium]
MLLAAADGLEIGRLLRDILVVLLAAKLAAEVAERIGVPAVLGEILAGIAIGPSLLGVVEQSDVLFMLGELGVILLLLQVGMEMDLAELGKVGRASMLVAVTGVAAPFATGAVAGLALGQDAKSAIFLGAALTATSVGITARVFGDLKALASTESRIVLGAAVADDVLGLVILTVVARVVVDGSVSAGTILSTIGLAIGFLLLTGIVGLWAAPAIFGGVHRLSRSTGTLTAIAFAFTLAFATLADVAKLAPIIGAFMAGLAIGRTKQAHRVERELTPVGHLFIPIFFLQIGIDTDIGAVLKPSVLGIAGVLTVVAVIGKLVAAVGAAGTLADRWTIGFGMIPRGEVGLIFATIGLRNGVLDDDLYAALVLVVLVTTVITPPLLRMRSNQLAARSVAPIDATLPRPPDGWVVEHDHRIELLGMPPPSDALAVALRAARLAVGARPGDTLLDWFTATKTAPLAWDDEATAEFLALLRHGNARSWRLLDRTGVLERTMPELAAALAARHDDPGEVDPLHALRWRLVDRLHELAGEHADGIGRDDHIAAEIARLEHPDRLVLAALALDVGGDPDGAEPVARSIVTRLALPDAAQQEVAALVRDAELLSGAVDDPDAFGDEQLQALCSQIGSMERARVLYVLSIVLDEPQGWQRERLDELHQLVVDRASQLESGSAPQAL